MKTSQRISWVGSASVWISAAGGFLSFVGTRANGEVALKPVIRLVQSSAVKRVRTADEPIAADVEAQQVLDLTRKADSCASPDFPLVLVVACKP
jgi:hypothetical protein